MIGMLLEPEKLGGNCKCHRRARYPNLAAEEPAGQIHDAAPSLEDGVGLTPSQVPGAISKQPPGVRERPGHGEAAAQVCGYLLG